MALRTILLIDGDQFLHRGCSAVEKDIRWDSENHVLSANEIDAWEVVEGSIKKVFRQLGSEDHVIAFSDFGGSNFRTQIDPIYKSHRANSRKPLCFVAVRERVQAAFTCRQLPGLEADDVMGILSTKPGKDRKIIVSQDKDMRTVPGWLYNTELEQISEADADYFHLYQTLVGDPSDGYKGCPGVGPVKAEKLLTLPGDVHPGEHRWDRVATAYEKAGLTEDDAIRNAQMARILRWTDWDANLKLPILWTPSYASVH